MAAAATRLRGCGLPPPSPPPSATAAAVATPAAVASPAIAAGLLLRTRPWRRNTRRQSDTDAASSRWCFECVQHLQHSHQELRPPHSLSPPRSLASELCVFPSPPVPPCRCTASGSENIRKSNCDVSTFER
ncbi:uncharacterized protein LOC125028594 [Penaeus chinensis]|uniref:uncharacterized protein LOC125028594 n=1 Tax=Penaeus chinensis TaxID=139456 RepID=UPI001FB584C3|nr:uncharacterized protein LOC125028594 [Penaeus chinensis]